MLNAITITDLHKSFGANHVLRGVNLTVEPGESMVVIGGSGSGKSTLLRHVMALEHGTSGTVKILGRDPAALDAK